MKKFVLVLGLVDAMWCRGVCFGQRQGQERSKTQRANFEDEDDDEYEYDSGVRAQPEGFA